MNAQTPERLHVGTPGVAAAEFLYGMVRGMVRQPDQVVLYWTCEEGLVIVDVELAPEDVGRLVGRGGSNARSIRTILDAVGAVQGVRYQLNLQRSIEGAKP